jgi:YidC/Oxa1 family membrane protein insertase
MIRNTLNMPVTSVPRRQCWLLSEQLRLHQHTSLMRQLKRQNVFVSTATKIDKASSFSTRLLCDVNRNCPVNSNMNHFFNGPISVAQNRNGGCVSFRKQQGHQLRNITFVPASLRDKNRSTNAASVSYPLWNERRSFFTFTWSRTPPDTTDVDAHNSAAGVISSTTNTTDNDGIVAVKSFDDDDDDDDDNDFRMRNTTNTDIGNDSPSVDETLNKLFEEQSSPDMMPSDAWYAAAETVGTAGWEPSIYNVADNAILTINAMQQFTGLPYGLSIMATTILLRIGLFPIMVYAQRTASRMAHVQPELTVLKDRYERISAPSRKDQMQFSSNMKGLFRKYKVNPFNAILAPAIQIPLFIGMFFGLKKVATYFPEELKNGGMLWFVDLSVPDPHYILPLLSSATFLVLVELGKDQMIRAGGSSVALLNVLRFMCLMSIPLVANFEAAMLMYWISNNLLTCCQTALLKAPTVRKYLGIWDPPKPPPGTDPNKDSLTASMNDLVKRAQGKPITDAQKIQKHNQEVEAKKVSVRLTRAARERERRKSGITGTRNF